MAENNTAAEEKRKPDEYRQYEFGKFILSKTKDWAGFIVSGLVLAAIGYFSGADSHAIAFLGLVHIAIIFAIDFVHKKPLRKVHLSVILFWIFYILADYGMIKLAINLHGNNLETEEAAQEAYNVPDIILSLIVGMYIADILDKLRTCGSKKAKGKSVETDPTQE